VAVEKSYSRGLTVPDRNPGLLDLLIQLEAHDAEVVVHPGGFVGVRARSLRRLPDEVWALLDRHEATLLGMVKRTTPRGRRQPKEV
jgi:hypothetical protein